MNSALVGVLFGSAISLLSTFGLEAWRDRQRHEESEEKGEQSVRQAVRLVVLELSDIDLAIRESVSLREYWVKRLPGWTLPTDTWNKYRDVLALHLPPEPWRLVAEGFGFANELNWRLRAKTLAPPQDSEGVRLAWRAARRAIVQLHPYLGETGSYGYAGYKGEGELERSVWGDVSEDGASEL
jgi:hypothetical protein